MSTGSDATGLDAFKVLSLAFGKAAADITAANDKTKAYECPTVDIAGSAKDRLEIKDTHETLASVVDQLVKELRAHGRMMEQVARNYAEVDVNPSVGGGSAGTRR